VECCGHIRFDEFHANGFILVELIPFLTVEFLSLLLYLNLGICITVDALEMYFYHFFMKVMI